MGLSADEQIRRKEIEQAAEYLVIKNGKIELDSIEIRQKILAEFTKQLDGKIKNLQENEGLLVIFTVDIISNSGKVRGGSGSQRNMPEYVKWREAVFSRDNFVCQHCGRVGGILNAHHIKAWSSHQSLRFDVDNGVTLCIDCHSKEHPHLKLIG